VLILSRSDVPPWHASAYALAQLQHDVSLLEKGGAANGRALRARARRSRKRALALSRTVASQRTEALRLAGTLSWLEGRARPARRLWTSIGFGGRSMLDPSWRGPASRSPGTCRRPRCWLKSATEHRQRARDLHRARARVGPSAARRDARLIA
jgi:hypothetical protein